MSLDEFLLSADTTDLNYPEIRPTLDLNFARTKTLDPRITFRRASGGSYFGPDGRLRLAGVNEARFTHDPVTGESLGLLVEEQRTNLLVRSEEFDNVANWVPGGGSVTANSIAAPTGATTADTWTSTAGQIASLYQQVACSASTAYTFSFYVRLGTLPAADFRIAVRDDSNAAFIAQDVVPNVTPVSTEWRRVIYTFTTPAGCTLVRPYLIRFGSTTGGTIHFWGAQLEAGAFPTSYIPTTTAAATRSADVASITGAAFSSWYRQDEGTVFAEAISAVTPVGGAARRIFDINNNSDSERLFVGQNTTSLIQYFIQDDGSIQANLFTAAPAPSANNWIRTAASYKTNDFTFLINGGAVNSDTLASVPSPTQMEIGARGTAANASLNSTIRRLTYWPQRLPNSTLQELTR